MTWSSHCCTLACMTEPVRGRVLTGMLWIGCTKKATSLTHRARPSRWCSQRKGLSAPKNCSRRYSANAPDEAWQLICLLYCKIEADTSRRICSHEPEVAWSLYRH